MTDQDTKKFLLAEGYAAIAWASSPGAQAQFAAAQDTARRIGTQVTDAELTAILWAAAGAEPADDPSGRTRVRRELKFEPEGGDDDTLPAVFQLLSWDTPQVKDGRYAGGWTGTGPPMRTVLAGRIGRRELEKLLADGIANLAWDGSVNG
jgi:hypothetical protein